MSVDPDGSLAAFKRLIEHAQAHPEVEAPVTLTEALAGRERAPVLRACAIPHELSRDLFRALWDWPSTEEADRCFDDFAELSIVQPGPNSLTMHDRWRKPLWSWWLREESRSEFKRISQRLTEYFSDSGGAAGGAAAAEARLREHMYHLLGADQPAGFTLFEALFRRARHQWRFTECSTLVRLVHDYDPVLTPDQQAVIGYQEGKLAADLRDWKLAEETFRAVDANTAASTAGRIKAKVRLGQTLREQRRVPEALTVLEQALASADAQAGLRELRWRILQELGEVYRDTGAVDKAETTVVAAIDAAQSAPDLADFAGLHNSLGTIYLKRRDAARAVEAFKRSLAELDRAGDAFRPAQVLNNLALAYAEQRDWPAAESEFSRSLELKRQAGDLLGQGLALQNLSRVQAAQDRLEQAIASSAAAVELFSAQGDKRRAGLAKQALGKYTRRRGDVDGASKLLEQAVALLEAAGDDQGAGAARRDLLELRRRIGLPWWSWVVIGFVVLFFVLIVVALVFS